MLRQKIVVVIVTLAVFSASAVGIGQEPSKNAPKSISLLDQLDRFGKKLVGNIFPDRSANGSKMPSASNNSRFHRGPMQSGFSKGRTGSVLDATQKTSPAGKALKPAKNPSQNNYSPNVNRRTSERRAAERRAAIAKNSRPQNQPQAVKTPVETRPLHERLMGLSRSSFSPKAKHPAAKGPLPAKAVTKGHSVHANEDRDVAAAMGRALAKSTVASKRTPALKTKPALMHKNAVAKPTPAMKKPVTKKVLAKKTAAKPALAKKPAAKKPVANTAVNKNAAKLALARKLPAKGIVSGNVLIEAGTTARPGDNVLFERRSPMLNVRTMGPRHITVGKESTYTVFMDNLGKAEAHDVEVAIELPQWADVLGAQPSQGTTRRLRADNGHRRLDWQVGNLVAGGSKQIVLRIVPRESRPIELGVSWNFKPAVSQTVIEVQEPKLEINLNGPREIAFGKCQKYQLEIVNTGNGLAEDVAITLMPVAPGMDLPSTHRLGAFPAGKKMALEIALTARQKDGLAVKVDLLNEGKVCARLNEKILVRKAEVEMVADGPGMQYVGTVATYRIRLRNTGNADAKHLNVTAKIPSEAKYLASDGGGKLLEGQGKAVWSLASLTPGTEKILVLKCELVQAGFNRIDVKTTADGQNQISTAVGTNVEAMADLTLEVVDPTGPVPVGKETVYQIRIRNRGSKQADGVEAVAYFSQGIEPISVSGKNHTLGPGRVLFRDIGTLEAGKEVLLKITARADMPGSHMFRAEVHCKPLNTKLVSEETTLFFNGTLVADRPIIKRQTANRQPADRPTVESEPKKTVLEESRTADRRNPWDGVSAPAGSRESSPDGQKVPTLAPRYRSQRR